MPDAPEVKPGDWIKVGSIDCVVSQFRGDDLMADGALQVVTNPERPAVYDAKWTGHGWSFAHPMRGDYAEHSPATAPYVEIMKNGPLGRR